MGAVLVEEAGGKGLQGSMGQLGRPSVDEGSCHRVLEEAGCLSGFRMREELDKTGGFFAPSSSCFNAKDDEATSSAAHEFWVCALLSASGFGQGGSGILPGPAPWLAISGEGRNYGGVNCYSWAPPPNRKAVCDHFNAAIVLSVDVVKVQVCQ